MKSTMRAAATALGLILCGACGGSTPPPDNPDPNPPVEPAGDGDVAPASSAEVQKGIEAIQAENFEEAKAVLAAAHEANPEDAQAAYYLGVALDQLGETDQAIEKFRVALDKDPKLAEAAVNLSGILLDVKKDPDAALEVLEAAAKNHPDHPQLVLNHALALYDKGEFDKAVAPLKKAVTLVKEDPSIRLMLVDALARSGQRDDAVSALKEVKPGDAETAGKVANLFGKLKAFPECIAVLDKSISDEATADLHVRRGACRHGNKDGKGAQEDYEAAIGLDANFAPAHYYLGRHLCSTGAKKKGRESLEQAAKIGEGQGVAGAAKKALEKCK